MNSYSTSRKKIKDVELNKTKNIIYNNTGSFYVFGQRNSNEDLLGVEKSSYKAKFITYDRASRRKMKKTYAEVVESGNSSINEGIKCGKNCTILTGNKFKMNKFCKNASEAASISNKVYNKSLLNQNVPQCVDILNKTVVDPSLEKTYWLLQKIVLL